MLKDILRRNRERLKLKQSDVADRIGVATQTYMKWENGKNEPKASDINKLAKILDVTATEICQGKMHDDDPYEIIEFMKKVASLQQLIDDVSFTSLLYKHIKEKGTFISELEKEIKEKHGFSYDDIEQNRISDEAIDIALTETEVRSDLKWDKLP